MSEQTEALNFGPQWIRDLSNGTSVAVPPPSPGPTYKLAQFRYGKEEMLALFSKDLKFPKINKDVADFILNKDVRNPLALMPLTEEEQRNSFGSLNSVAVLKMMGRGGQRGGRGMSRGSRGAGRGQPGFYRGFSQDDSTKTDEGWQRDRKTSWGENAGRGFGSSTRDTETSPRGYDPTASSGRHGRALASGNWRSSESGEGDDDGGGWITTGSRGSERWRTSSSRDNWHREEHSRGGSETWNKSWNRSGDRNSFDDVPEWSKPDNVFEPDSGSFDDTGSFCVTKDKQLHDNVKDSQDSQHKEDWEEELKEDNHVDESKCDDVTKDAETLENKANGNVAAAGKNSVKLQDPQANAKDIQQQANVKEIQPAEDVPPGAEEKAAGVKNVLPADEVGANLERVAESCIANLDVESEEASEERQTKSLERSVEETRWFYRDPQGLEQGPFSNEEMVEWFHHGYFTMQLSVRRQCDDVYLSLGDLIKRWKRVPFLPGASPPPITHRQVMNEQTMFVQQQLIQQHYQHLQKQAILQQMQQQQQQHQQQQRLQQEQRQQAVESSLQLNFNSPDSRSLRTTVVGPRSHPTTTHSGSPVGAAEMIWGPERQSPKNSWSPTGTPWNESKRHTSPVPSVEEMQRKERGKEIEREKERERVEAERKEAELLALRRKEEEDRAKQLKEEQRQEEKRLAELAKRQKEEEEKRELAKREEDEKKKVELETKSREKAEAEKRKQKEKEKKRKAEDQKLLEEERLADELFRKGQLMKQRQEELWKKQEAERTKREEQRKAAESKKQEEMKVEAERQKREKEAALKAELRRKEDSHQQGKSTSNGSSRWGSQNTSTMSLSEIQDQEEKNRRANEEKMKELQAKQHLSAAGTPGWSEKVQTPSSGVRSLKAIQDEQARQPSKQNKQSPRSQLTQASAAWSNNWTAGNNNVWTGSDREEQQEIKFWDDVVRVPTTDQFAQAQKTNTKKQQPKQSAATQQQPATNGKKSSKKTSKEEESVRRIFQEAASNDPFTEWCTQSLHGLATGVDVPTFISFLKDLESPYEVHTYVREYIGDSIQAKSFAKEFIERHQSSEWKHVPSKSNTTIKLTSGVVARGAALASRSEPESKTKKKKKQRMQKVDPSILGFSVNAAAERVNMGEIQTVEDSR